VSARRIDYIEQVASSPMLSLVPRQPGNKATFYFYKRVCPYCAHENLHNSAERLKARWGFGLAI